MKDSKKPKQVRVYLNAENEEMLKELAEHVTDLPEAQLMTMLVSASLRAAKENNYRICLPLHLRISEEVEKNDPDPRGITQKTIRR